MFSSPFFQDQLQRVMKQTTRDQVPITKQVSLAFICPPLDEQREIVTRVGLLLAACGRLQRQVSEAAGKQSVLGKRLIARAFTGELVTQDPTDEPALALLDRTRVLS